MCNILHVKQQQTENLHAGLEFCMGDVWGRGGGSIFHWPSLVLSVLYRI